MEYPPASVDVHRDRRHTVPVSSREQPSTLVACGPGVAHKRSGCPTISSGMYRARPGQGDLPGLPPALTPHRSFVLPNAVGTNPDATYRVVWLIRRKADPQLTAVSD